MRELPPNLSEADLLDHVEGARLSPAVAAALAADADLAAWAAGLRADRAALAGLSDAKAPAALMARVEAALEQDALATALGAESAAVGPVPVVMVHRTRGPVLARIGGWPALAVAAALALVAGLSWVAVSSRPAARPGATAGPLISAAMPDAWPSSGADTPAPSADPGRDLALISEPPGPSDFEPALTGTGSTAAATAAGADSPGTPAPWGMPLDRALALAAQGRLLIEIDSAELDRTGARLDSLTRLRASAMRIHARAEPAGRALVALARARADARAAHAFAVVPPAAVEPARLASDASATPPAPGPEVVVLPHPDPPRAARAVLPAAYELDVLAAEAALDSALRGLCHGARQRARLVILSDDEAALVWPAPEVDPAFVGPPVELMPVSPARVSVPVVARER